MVDIGHLTNAYTIPYLTLKCLVLKKYPKGVFQGRGLLEPPPMSSPLKNILCQVGLIYRLSKKNGDSERF